MSQRGEVGELVGAGGRHMALGGDPCLGRLGLVGLLDGRDQAPAWFSGEPHRGLGVDRMKSPDLLPSASIGAVASARSMTPMAALSAARLSGRRTPGRLVLLDHPLFKFGALAMGLGELLGDKMKSAPDRTVFLGLLARTLSAGIAGAALAPKGRERAGAPVAISTAVPMAYLTLAGRKRAMARVGQTSNGLVEDAAILSIGFAVVALFARPGR